MFIFSIFGDAVTTESNTDPVFFIHLPASGKCTKNISGFYESLTGKEKIAQSRPH